MASEKVIADKLAEIITFTPVRKGMTKCGFCYSLIEEKDMYNHATYHAQISKLMSHTVKEHFKYHHGPRWPRFLTRDTEDWTDRGIFE